MLAPMKAAQRPALGGGMREECHFRRQDFPHTQGYCKADSQFVNPPIERRQLALASLFVSSVKLVLLPFTFLDARV